MNRARALFTLVLLSAAFVLALPTSRAQDNPQSSYQALVRFEGDYHLWDVATGDLILLHGLADVEWTQSSWSPDGAYLLVSPYGENNCCSGLYDVERQMWDARTFESRAVWSPDGRYIAWSRHNDETSEIVLLDRESQEENVIYSIDYEGWFKGFQSLSWSPDSQSIFFVLFWERLGGRNNYARVFHFPSQEVFVVDEGLDAWYAGYNPIWSPDGRYFLVHMETTGPYVRGGHLTEDEEVGDLYLFDAHTGERHRITDTPLEREFSVGWSNDGSHILYSVVTDAVVDLDVALAMDDSATDRSTIPELSILQYNGYEVVVLSPDGRIAIWKSAFDRVVIGANDNDDIISTIGTHNGTEIDFISWRPLPS